MKTYLAKIRNLSSNELNSYKNTKNYLIKPIDYQHFNFVTYQQQIPSLFILQVDKTSNKIALFFDFNLVCHIYVHKEESYLYFGSDYKMSINPSKQESYITFIDTLHDQLVRHYYVKDFTIYPDICHAIFLLVAQIQAELKNSSLLVYTKRSDHQNQAGYFNNLNDYKMIVYQRSKNQTINTINETNAVRITDYLTSLVNRFLDQQACADFSNKAKIISLNLIYDWLEQKYVLGVLVTKDTPDFYMFKTINIEDLLVVDKENKHQSVYLPNLFNQRLQQDDYYDLLLNSSIITSLNYFLKKDNNVWYKLEHKNQIRAGLLDFYSQLYNLKRILTSNQPELIKTIMDFKMIDLDGKTLNLKETMNKYASYLQITPNKYGSNKKGRI